jgi:aryl-alcohol dehydrogenase-like predicted oxidoreductase
MTQIPGTSLEVYPLCLGGNVFGWSADEVQSTQVLDSYSGSGGNFIDTADVYSEWAPGNKGGESETIIGNWMASRGNRSSMIIATKVAKLSRRSGLSGKNIIAACEESLARLRSDYIDLYYAHEDDLKTPIEETLKAFDSLIKSGKVRYIASSNFSLERLERSLQISQELGIAHYVAAQDLYNLLDRQKYETRLRDLIAKHNLSVLPYYSLAKGFLSGKYKRGEKVDSVRAAGTIGYQNERGWDVLGRVEELAQRRDTTMSAIALAWLRAQPTVSVPIASARTVEQLVEIMPIVKLAPEEIEMLQD